MINAEDEILIDFRTSCTKDVAVAKMLGWMQGYRRNRNIMMTEYGIVADQLPSLHSLDDSLQDQLLELREAASQEFIDAAAKKDTAHKILEEKEKSVAKWDELIDKAGSYLLAIEEELDKGESSELKINQEATNNSGHTHLTINSVDRWARNRFSISIIENLGAEALPEDIQEQQEQEADCNGGLSKTVADNLYTSFALLVEASAEKASKYTKGETLNVSAIAKYIEQLSIKAKNKKPPEPISGQGHESIKKHIVKAMKIKKSKLPEG